MRTIVKNALMLIVVLMLGATTIGLAKGTTTDEPVAGFNYVMYVVKNKPQFVFAYAAQSTQRVVLTIRDAQGTELHKDFFNEKEVGRVYDLKKYGNGTYNVEVKTGDFYEKKSITIEAAPALSAKINALENKKVEVTYANNSNEPVNIYINDVRGETVYTETQEVKRATRIFDLATLPSGEYMIVIGNNDKTIGQIVKIKK
jgi:hypothetical protein